MKYLLCAFLLMTFTGYVFSQEAESSTEAKLAKLKKQIEKEADELKIKLEKNADANETDFQKQLKVEFAVDTFKINSFYSGSTGIDYSNAGMVNATINAEKEYDKLLNKYYKILLKKLSDPDKEILKQTQRNWIQFRDSEKKLIDVLSKEEYSGGGTIQSLNVTSAYLNLTQKRVLDLYNHLTGITE